MQTIHNIIIRAPADQFILAVRAARKLIDEGHKECIYAFEDGSSFYVKRTKANVVSTWQRKS